MTMTPARATEIVKADPTFVPGGIKRRKGGRRADTVYDDRWLAKYQQRMQGLLRHAVSDDDWLEVLQKALMQAKMGDDRARWWLGTWVMGKAPEKLEVEHSFTLADMMRRALDERADVIDGERVR